MSDIWDVLIKSQQCMECKKDLKENGIEATDIISVITTYNNRIIFFHNSCFIKTLFKELTTTKKNKEFNIETNISKRKENEMLESIKQKILENHNKRNGENK